ncbi:hypothetical protein HDE_08378 [Halotydeus destructor]|nr:hypothetical protein HDE_08378 [Halotydeus destructor]
MLFFLSLIGLALSASPQSSSEKAASTDSMATTIEWGANKLYDMVSEALNATSSMSKGRGAKSGFDGQYAMWNPSAAGKFDVLSLIPTLLIVGLGIMLLPVILSCFTQILTPMTYATGRRKREIGQHPLLSDPSRILQLVKTLHTAMDKFNF